MAENDKEPDDVPNSISNTELLKFVKEVSGHAEKEVARVSGIYKIAALGISFIMAVGVYWTYKDAAESRKEAAEFRKQARDEQIEQRKIVKDEVEHQEKQMHDRQEALFSQMQSNLSQQVLGLGRGVEKKVDEEFKSENINKLVTAKAQERIDVIADPIITGNISKKIQPKIDAADKSVKQVEEKIQLAHNDLQKVQNTAEFLSVVISAQNDDRPSFDKLKKWAEDSKFDRQADALQAYVSIVNAFESPLGYTYNVPWKEGLDPSKLSFQDLRTAYAETPPYELRAGILQYVWNRKDFSKKQKMSLMIDAMRSDKSLKVVAEASKLFQSESKQNKKRLLVDIMFEWWEKNKDTISDKPESEATSK